MLSRLPLLTAEEDRYGFSSRRDRDGKKLVLVDDGLVYVEMGCKAWVKVNNGTDLVAREVDTA